MIGTDKVCDNNYRQGHDIHTNKNLLDYNLTNGLVPAQRRYDTITRPTLKCVGMYLLELDGWH